MKIVYATQPLPKTIKKSIFLAGPTPRSNAAGSWRPRALNILRDMGFDGTVFVPESEDGVWKESYTDQVEWEELCLNAADCIVFWIPRNLETMPAFTTNIEFGSWISSGKCVVGAPLDAAKVRYIKHYVEKNKMAWNSSIEATLEEACKMLGEGAVREGGARMIPLHIYKTAHFQKWFDALKGAGNRLDDARVLWNFRVGEKLDYPLFWAIHVNVYVAEEQRNKTNEVVVSRPDISAIVAFRRSSCLYDTEICMIEEFRSPVANSDGFTLELPGGSSPSPEDDPQEVAAKEFFEETGLELPESRFQFVCTRQIASTSSTHSAALFAVELSKPEVDFLRAQQGKVHGESGSSEQTYVNIMTLAEILASGNKDGKGRKCDWSNFGMIMSAI